MEVISDKNAGKFIDGISNVSDKLETTRLGRVFKRAATGAAAIMTAGITYGFHTAASNMNLYTSGPSSALPVMVVGAAGALTLALAVETMAPRSSVSDETRPEPGQQ